MAEGIINEKTATEKILVIAGGIGSFGSLFPYFFQNVTKYNTDTSIENSFNGFTLLYLLLPTVIFLLWMLVSSRLQGFYLLKSNSSETESQQWVKKIHKYFLSLVLINFALNFLFVLYGYKNSYITILCYAAHILSFSFIFIFLLKVSKKHLEKTSKLSTFNTILFFASIIFLSAIISCSILYRKELVEINKNNQYNFEEILLVNNLKTNLDKMESETKNISDRFYLKSKLAFDNRTEQFQEKITNQKDSLTFFILQNEIKNKNIKLSINPYISFFNALILNNDVFDKRNNIEIAKFKESGSQIKVLIDSSIIYKTNIKKIERSYVNKDSIKSEKEKLERCIISIQNIVDTTIIKENYIKSVYRKLNLDPSYNKLYKDEHFINVHEYILLNINGSIAEEQQTRFPYYTTINIALKKLLDHSGEKAKHENLISTSNIDNALKEYFKIPLDSNIINSDSILNDSLSKRFHAIAFDIKDFKIYFEEYTAASFNFDNSQALYNWIQDYTAYAQRKTEYEIEETRNNVIGIWQTARKKGLVAFLSILVILVLYYLSLFACRWILAYEKELESNTNENAVGSETTNSDVNIIKEKKIADSLGKTNEKFEKLFQNLDWHIYPIITFMAIIFALLIPMFKEIKSEEIKLSSPNWMTSIPNWNLNSNFRDPKKDEIKPPTIECNCKCSPNIHVDCNGYNDALLKEIKINTYHINQINERLDCK